MVHSVVVVDLVFKCKTVAAFDDFVNRVLRPYPLPKSFSVLEAELFDLDLVEYCVVVVHCVVPLFELYVYFLTTSNYIKSLINC